jgi:hypothetical protein
MSNELKTAEGNGGGLVQLDPEAFAAHLTSVAEGEQARGDWVGQLLKFDRGVYKAGKERTIVPIGTELVAATDSYEVGWDRWVDGNLENRVTGFVSQGYQRPAQPPGNNDPALWPIDPKTGQRRNPWQKTARVILYKAKGDESSLYTFTASSVGGIGALGKLFEQAGRLMRMHPNCYPVVKLKADRYRHAKLNTDIDFPVFELVGWDQDPWTGAAIRKEAA